MFIFASIMQIPSKQKSLSPEYLKLAHARNWFRLFVPKTFGGAEFTLSEGLREMFEAGSINGSLGWCVNLGSGAGYFCGFMSDRGAEEILNIPEAAIAGSGKIGTCTAQGNHYLISGTWDKCTGSQHATAFTVNAQNEAGDIHSYVLLQEQVELVDQWELFGLKESSSFQITAKSTLVPEYLRFTIGEINPNTSYTIHQIPFDDFARFCMIASYLGIANCLLNEVRSDSFLYPNRVEKEGRSLDKLIQDLLHQFLTLADEVWETANDKGSIPNQFSEKLCTMVKTSSKQTFQCVNELFFAAGLRMADEKAPVHQAYKDFLMAGQHFLLK